MRRWLLVVTAALAHAGAPAAQEISAPGTPQWVGLFNDELIGWLENENRLQDLCRPLEGSPGWKDCAESYMEPKVRVITVRSLPDTTAPAVGSIVLVAVPGRGLRASFSAGGPAAPLVPDVFDPDWGYGPHFHQTVLERRGSWYRLPEDPLPAPAWIDAADWTDRADLRPIRAGDILSSPQGDLYVLDVQPEFLLTRPEQPADMWCEPGPAPALRTVPPQRLPLDALYDSKGHLVVRPKYLRGC